MCDLSQFHLSLLLWFCPVLLFGTYSSVSLICLTLCVCFCVLGKSAMSLALESSRLMKKRSCCVLLCSIFWSLESGASGISLVCVVCVLCSCGSVDFSFSPVICSDSLYQLWAIFGYSGVNGPVWGLVESGQTFARDTIVPNTKVLSLCAM